MTVNDNGRIEVGSMLIGSTPTIPDNIAFGTGSAAFNSTESYLNAEVESSPVIRTWVGNDVKYEAILTTLQANGSSIGEIGLGIGSPTGSDLWTRDLSAIGDKDNSFSATVSVTFKVSTV